MTANDKLRTLQTLVLLGGLTLTATCSHAQDSVDPKTGSVTTTPTVTVPAKTKSKDTKKPKPAAKPAPAPAKVTKAVTPVLPLSARKKILIYPPDTKGGLSDQLADVIVDTERIRLGTTGQYNSIQFSGSLPTIRRAVTEQSIAQAETNPPFDSISKVQKLTQLAGYPYALVSSLDDYQYDADKGQISIIMTIKLVDVSGDKTRIVNSVGDSLTSAAKAAKNADDLTPAIDLARKLTDQIMQELLKPAAPKPPKPTPPTTPDPPTPK